MSVDTGGRLLLTLELPAATKHTPLSCCVVGNEAMHEMSHVHAKLEGDTNGLGWRTRQKPNNIR